MPRVSETESWIKPFRRQIAKTCGESWYVRNNRGRISLAVSDAGTVSLPFEWTARGSALALPRIQQIFKGWNGGQITLAAAAQNADTFSSHQKLDFSQLIETYGSSSPTLATRPGRAFICLCCATAPRLSRAAPPVDGEALAMQCLAQWEQGTRMRQVCRQNLYSFLNWAVQRGHLKPIYSPPATPPEVLRPKRIGYPLSDAHKSC